MRNIKLLITFLFILSSYFSFGQVTNTEKGAAILYTTGSPTGTVRLKYDSEIAINTTTGRVWRYNRTNSTWIDAGTTIGYLNSTGVPTGSPKYGGPEMIINNNKEVYWYRLGSWVCVNCGSIGYTGGTGIDITGTVITNTLPDQTVVLNNGTGISVTGTYPNFTITNTSPDQTVTLTGAGISSITGTYPNFTITSTEVDGSTTNEIQQIDSLYLSNDTLFISLSSDGVNAKLVKLTGLTASSGGGIYGPSDTVTYHHLATIDSGLTFRSYEDTSYFNILTGLNYGSFTSYKPDSTLIRYFDIGGNNQIVLKDSGIRLQTTAPDRVTVQGADMRYSADYRSLYNDRSVTDKKYNDDYYLQYVDTLRLSNDTLYISLSNDSIPESFVVLSELSSSGLDTSGYNLEFRTSNDTLYIRDGDGELFTVLPQGPQVYDIDLIAPIPTVGPEGSMVLKTNDINGTKYFYASDGTNWIDGGLFLDTLAVATIHIGNNQVTYAKVQQVSASKLLGNPTGSTANVSEIGLGTGLGFSGTDLVNTAPDQTVVLTEGTGINITGTYPSFTITNTVTNTDAQTLSVDSTDIGGMKERFEISISNGNSIFIDVPQISGLGGGQNNVGINLGSGTGIYAGKTDTTLQFKSLTEGYGIDFSASSTEINIKADTTQLATLYDISVVQADIDAHELADGDLSSTNELQTLSIDSSIVGSLERFELSISDGNTIYFDIPQPDGTGTDDQTLSLDSASTTNGQNFILSIEDGNSVSWFIPNLSSINTIYNSDDSILTDRYVKLTNKLQFLYEVIDERASILRIDSIQTYIGTTTLDGSTSFGLTNEQYGSKSFSLESSTTSGAASYVTSSTTGNNSTLYITAYGNTGTSVSTIFLDTIGVKILSKDSYGTSGQILYSDGTYTYWDDLPTDNDNQTLSIDSVTISTGERYAISISSGNTIYLDDDDHQDLSLSGNTLSLTNDASTVDLSGYLDNTDSQTLSLDSIDLVGIERFYLSISGGNSLYFDDDDNQTVDTFSLSGTTLTLALEGDRESPYTVDFTNWDTDVTNDLSGSGASPRLAIWSGTQSLTSSSTLVYETNTMHMYPSANDTVFSIIRGSRILAINTFTDPFNGAVNAYGFGGLLGNTRIFMKGFGYYMDAPFYQSQTAGIGFYGTTGNMQLNTNGDQYVATLTGDNQTTNRNLTFYFTSGGSTSGKGNPVIFQQIYSNNDTLCNSFEFLARNTASGGITHPDSTLFRIGNWDRGTALNILQNRKVGVQTRTPSRDLDVNGEVRIRDLTTINPTMLVGTESTGVLNKVILGTGLTMSNDTLYSSGTGSDTNIYTTNGNVKNGGTIVDVSGDDPIIFNLDASGSETNRMLRLVTDYSSDDAITYFTQMVAPQDSLIISSYDNGITVNYEGPDGAGTGFSVISNTTITLTADSLITSSILDRSEVHSIVGMYGTTVAKISGYTDNQTLVWDNTCGCWSVGSSPANNIYTTDGTITDYNRTVTLDSSTLKFDLNPRVYVNDTDWRLSGGLTVSDISAGYGIFSSNLQRIATSTDITGQVTVTPFGVTLTAQTGLDGPPRSYSVQIDTTGFYLDGPTGESLPLVFYETSGGNTTKIQAGNQSASYTYILPIDDPNDGDVLTYNSGDQLSWEAPSAGGGSTTEYYVESQTGTTLDLSTGTLAATKGTGTLVNLDLPVDITKVDIYKNGVLLSYTDGSTTRDYSYNNATEVITLNVSLISSDRITIIIRN